MANVELNIHVQVKELQKNLKKVEAGQKKLAAQSGKTVSYTHLTLPTILLV